MKKSQQIIPKLKVSKSLLAGLSIIFFTALTSNTLQAQNTIPVDSVENYIGKTVKVCDKVYGTHITKGEKKTTYLNLGADYPNNKLTIVIFERDLPNFGYVPAVFLKDKNVCVTGKVVTYKEKPQIIISESSSLTYE